MGSALLLHGLGSGPATLWRVREWLEADGWEVETPALLGHGDRGPAPSYSIGAYAEDVLPRGDYDLVVGHSLGGSVAIHAAATRPEWTKRLVLIEPAISLPQETIAVAKPSELDELTWTRAQIAEYLPRWDARDVDAKFTEAGRALPEAVERTFTDNAVWDLAPDAERIAVPTLVVVGDRDVVYSIIDEATWARLTAVNPHIEFVAVPRTGHSPHRDDPVATQAIIKGWLAATNSADTPAPR